MTDQIPLLEPPHTALLVMDYQTAIVARMRRPTSSCKRARVAIDLVRDRVGRLATSGWPSRTRTSTSRFEPDGGVGA